MKFSTGADERVEETATTAQSTGPLDTTSVAMQRTLHCGPRVTTEKPFAFCLTSTTPAPGKPLFAYATTSCDCTPLVTETVPRLTVSTPPSPARSSTRGPRTSASP